MINSIIFDLKISRKMKLFLICFVSSIIITYLLFEKYPFTLSPKVQVDPVLLNFTSEQFIQKKFVYLVQTEECLSELLLQIEYFSNPTECQCDVIVYSFKVKCLNSRHRHIIYLYEPNSTSTWNTGRNLFWNTGRNHFNLEYRQKSLQLGIQAEITIARGRNVSYLYYIFLDGDIYLAYNEMIAPDTMKTKSPMRSFEQFLIKREPGIGVTDYRHHHGANSLFQMC